MDYVLCLAISGGQTANTLLCTQACSHREWTSPCVRIRAAGVKTPTYSAGDGLQQLYAATSAITSTVNGVYSKLDHAVPGSDSSEDLVVAAGGGGDARGFTNTMYSIPLESVNNAANVGGPQSDDATSPTYATPFEETKM